MTNKKLITKIISVYSFSHAIVDFSCAAVIYSFACNINVYLLLKLVILYNSLAFGLQSVFGLFADKYIKPQIIAVVGCLCLITGMCIYENPTIAVLLIGVGNAMFHAGGGCISLNLGKGKSKLPGIFVAPGAVGLFLGSIWKRFFDIDIIWLAFIPLFALASILFTDVPDFKEQKINTNSTSIPVYAAIAILILLSVAIRSFIGLSYNFSGKDSLYLTALLVFSVAMGKLTGGFLADKFGMFNIAVLGLLISVPLLKLGNIPFFAMLGMFFFNLTMPVTVTALSNMMPKYKGFSFGLTTLALLIGFLPVFKQYKIVQSSFLFEIIIISAIITAISLKLYEKLFNRS